MGSLKGFSLSSFAGCSARELQSHPAEYQLLAQFVYQIGLESIKTLQVFANCKPETEPMPSPTGAKPPGKRMEQTGRIPAESIGARIVGGGARKPVKRALSRGPRRASRGNRRAGVALSPARGDISRRPGRSQPLGVFRRKTLHRPSGAENCRRGAQSRGWLAMGYRMPPATRASEWVEAVMLAPLPVESRRRRPRGGGRAKTRTSKFGIVKCRGATKPQPRTQRKVKSGLHYASNSANLADGANKQGERIYFFWPLRRTRRSTVSIKALGLDSVSA